MPGTESAIRVMRVVNAIMVDEELPAPSDEKVLKPPVLWIWCRPVPGTRLAVHFAFDDDNVWVYAVAPYTSA